MTELWDLVSENGEPMGITWERRNMDKIPEGCCFPCVEVWVKVGERLLITQRHPSKSEPLKYDLPGGGVLSGEDILEGAVRELFEEVGISASPDQFKRLGALAMGKAYATSYILTFSSLPEIKLQPTEVVGYKLVSEEELEEMLDELTRGTRRRYLMYKDRIFNKKD